ncbi:SSS family transporter [Lewinella marina]|uniref:Sodium transporter n=1 Tax=Neolewinella marina TaxID=438751 RepID=A0A2G0CCH3_9BACT|nr:sodium/solute symporter [Neolewinella marina]NJB87623.1 SSS family transporter [Neolewinella marina]PHK97689.1 sodium transporter [Neolewinella marina]
MNPPTYLLSLLLILLLPLVGVAQVTVTDRPALPAAEGDSLAFGYAGMVGGKTGGVLIAAGGANFSRGMPWAGGSKVYSDDIYLLRDGQWTPAEERLPTPLAYGASVATPEGILVLGGETGSETSDRAFLLSYDAAAGAVRQRAFPALPEPLAYAAAVMEDDSVYVVGGMNAGGSVRSFYRIPVHGKGNWERLPDLPGPGRALHAAGVQESPTGRKLYVVGGRRQRAGEKSLPLTDYLTYDFHTGRWSSAGEMRIDGRPMVRMGGSLQPLGSMHLLLYGGSDEVIFDELERLALEASATMDTTEADSLHRRSTELLTTHPGFSRDVLALNTVTGRWFVYDTLEAGLPVTTLAVDGGDGALTLVSGEVSPGVRTAAVRELRPSEAARPFGWVNYGVLAGYLLLSVLIGVYFSRKQHSTADYFTGGGRIPWWASGLSVFGTLLSAITFMAIPAKSFTTDWSFFMLNITAILITPVIAFLFIPFFNRLHIRTAYEYLETRFNYAARAFGSLSFILFQLGRIGIVLLLPSLAISIVTGMPVEASILIMGVLCIMYTTFGGIEAVVWTDVLQVVVLLGGSILAVVWILLHTESSWSEMLALAQEHDKFNVVDLDFDFTRSTFWVVFFGGLASAMVTQGTDQTIVQRYLTSSSVRDSQRTLYTNALLTLPATVIFFGLGTLLFVFYSERPQALSPALSNNDSIFPWYIVRELPVGVSGLLIAGIFSAAMSSISSSLNSVSTAFCNDFYRHFRPGVADLRLLRIARYATVATGVAGVLLALWMANASIQSLWDEFYRFLGLFTGGLGGLFLLGMLTTRANAPGALLGLAASAVVIYYVSVFTAISFLLYAFIGVVTCFVFGYGFSLLFTRSRG